MTYYMHIRKPAGMKNGKRVKAEDGFKVVENAKPFKLHPEIDCFIHKEVDEKGKKLFWVINETTTGFKICDADTRKEVAEKAKDILNGIGIASFKKKIEEVIAKEGRVPLK